MSSDAVEEVLRLLGLLGLNSYQSRVYVALYRHGSMNVRELSRTSDVPYARCYDVASSLEKLGLLVSVPARPRRFEAVDPGRSLRRLIVTRIEEIDEEKDQAISRSQSKAEQKKRTLGETLGRVTALLPSMISPSTRRSEPMWTIEGWTNIQTTAIDMLKGSRQEFLFTVSPPPWSQMLSYPYFWGDEGRELYETVAKGVSVRGLVPESTLASYLGLGQLGVPTLRATVSVPAKFAISDSSTTLIGLRDPETGLDRSSAIFIQSEGISSIFKSFFESMWSEATAIREILSDVDSHTQNQLTKLRAEGTDIELRVFKALLQRGMSTVGEIQNEMRVYDRKETPSKVEVSAAMRSLLSKNWVVHDQILDTYIPFIRQAIEHKPFQSPHGNRASKP